MSRTRVALAGATVAAVAVGGTAGSALAVLAPQKVAVGAREYSFTLSKKTLKKGKVTFTIANKGTEVHDFKVIGLTPKSKFLAGGQSTRLTLTFKKAGRYQYLCTIGEHAIKGMQGVLIVK